MAGPTRQSAIRKAGLTNSNIRNASGSVRPPSRAGLGTHASRTMVPPSPAHSIASTRMGSPTKRKKQEEEEDSAATNINVVVRVRGRSEREIRDNSTVCVSTPGGPRGKEVSLTLGAMGLNNKTYSFDRAFGPEADQARIYDDVAAPILEEMLGGYNCTIFAYGQTGTGKTYTMSGDMSDNFGTYSDSAGIIPRALYNLFTKLDAEERDYTVKCSFIELYNEELRDLLQTDEHTKVKIFEDSTKKGIVIQGMEESFIKSAEEGVKLLQEGSHKRQVAATKCNDLSSRSHTVFTITVHVKELNEETGEDLLRTGKLNLVDLAGSENIGRSGAENKRAREAGMINQSLLTLGRVINALVDKSPHIPYRESKLTRLLQDSLGGRTKTCIIATISPAKINVEETMSTLDYAARAKNIKNKPQINQMMTKKALIREYVLEIERLKADLVAARQKNGVFLTQESYNELTEQNESQRIITEEQQRKIDALENQIKNVREQFETTMRSFIDTKKNLEKSQGELDEVKNILEETEIKLSTTKKSLAEETIVRKAHAYTEGKLDSIGQKLITQLDTAVEDISLLHEKNDKKTQLEQMNAALWTTSKTRVDEVTTLVDREIEAFTATHQKVRDSLADKMNAFLAEQTEKLEKAQKQLEEMTESFLADEQKLVGDSVKAKNDMNEVLEEIKTLREDVKERVGEGLKGLNDAAQKIVAEVTQDLEKFQVEIHASYNRLGKDFRQVFDDMQKHIVSQKAVNETLRTELLTATSAAVTANSTAQTTLQTILDEERALAAEERTNLISQITALINTVGEQQERRVTKRISLVQTAMQNSGEELAEAESKYKTGMDEWDLQEDKFKESITESKNKIKTQLVDHWQDAEKKISGLQGTTSTLHSQTLSLVDQQIQTLSNQMSALDTFLSRAKSHNEQQSEEHLEALGEFANTAKSTFAESGTRLSEVKADIEDFANATLPAELSSLDDIIPPLSESTLPALRQLRDNITSASFERYQPTGTSPLKRPYDYPHSLPRTLPREKLLGHDPSSRIPSSTTVSTTASNSSSARSSSTSARTSPPSSPQKSVSTFLDTPEDIEMVSTVVPAQVPESQGPPTKRIPLGEKQVRTNQPAPSSLSTTSNPLKGKPAKSAAAANLSSGGGGGSIVNVDDIALAKKARKFDDIADADVVDLAATITGTIDVDGNGIFTGLDGEENNTVSLTMGGAGEMGPPAKKRKGTRTPGRTAVSAGADGTPVRSLRNRRG